MARASGHPFDRELYNPKIEQARVNGTRVAIDIQSHGGGPLPFKATAVPSGSARPRLLFKHLSKAGGTFVIATLHRLIPSHLLTVRMEGQAVSRADQQLHFVVGLAREPCSALVSLWAYGSSGKGQFLDEFRRHAGKVAVRPLYGLRSPFNTSADVERFRTWARLPEVRAWRVLASAPLLA